MVKITFLDGRPDAFCRSSRDGPAKCATRSFVAVCDSQIELFTATCGPHEALCRRACPKRASSTGMRFLFNIQPQVTDLILELPRNLFVLSTLFLFTCFFFSLIQFILFKSFCEICESLAPYQFAALGSLMI